MTDPSDSKHDAARGEGDAPEGHVDASLAGQISKSEKETLPGEGGMRTEEEKRLDHDHGVSRSERSGNVARSTLRMNENTFDSKASLPPLKKKMSSTLLMAPTLVIGDTKYFKSLKTYSCCDCQECCFPSVMFKTNGDTVYKIQHGCACLPCCFQHTASDSKNKIGSFVLGGCCDTACCGSTVVDGKFLNPTGDLEFVLKHETVCCDGVKVNCCACCHCCGCLQCVKYYCTDEQYILYMQPVFRKITDESPAAFFKRVDRISGPCCWDETIASSIEPVDELTKNDWDLLTMYLILTSGYAHRELGWNWRYIGWNVASPFGLEGIDAIRSIHKRGLTEKEAIDGKLIQTIQMF
uniref:Phospholipid scramblase n=1 Tax=Lotharella globosa TaxID=91324 RepID=A0A6V3SFF8_9EUKA|eukprot:CAMPEP_0167794148 /NCGR_PEP_ID=MMETSP0111_2-20121227/13639_1 /TAXON_ID=91324 /ORGANISM="Lotharella globosa, Strain CCCM811" /LENGTH=351 /DNA_ID=CAMNT_0007687513 /DNA_START=26 /DNA_END=1081 /DNA_ORIENTATION=-